MTASESFGAGSSTLTATGALVGSADVVFGHGSSALTGTGALAGTATLVFGGSATADGTVPPEVAGAYPRPAGRSRGRPKKVQRYELPNGMHVFGTADEALALAQSLVDEPVVVRRSRPKYKVTVRVADGAKAQAKAVFPVERMGKTTDTFIDVTQAAPSRDIQFDAVVAVIAQRALRRRKISMLLLMS